MLMIQSGSDCIFRLLTGSGEIFLEGFYMKKVYGVLVVMVIAGLVLSGCANPNAELFEGEWGRAITWSDADKDEAIVVVAEPSLRTNSSGTKIKPNQENAEFPGMWYSYKNGDKDDGYLKVEGWVLDKYESFTITIQVDKNYWDYVIYTPSYQAEVDGFLTFLVGNTEKGNKEINNVWVSEYVLKPPVAKPILNLGFIGYYLNPDTGKAQQTSFYWQDLKEGDLIDWDAVDAAYAEWVAGGGLPIYGTHWHSSGFQPINFEYRDPVGYDDFGADQLEGYYHSYYVSPDYELPTVELGFIGWYGQKPDGSPMQTSFYWQTLRPGETIDWDAVDAAYADWVAQGGLEPDRTFWQTSGPESFTFADYAAVGYKDFTEGQLESYYQAFYVDPGYKLPQLPPDDPDPKEKCCKHVVYKPCQDKDKCFRFSVKHTEKGKCTTYNHCEKVPSGKNSCIFSYPKYKVEVKWDKNCKITSCCIKR